MKASFYSLECVGLNPEMSRLAQLYFELGDAEQLHFEELTDEKTEIAKKEV